MAADAKVTSARAFVRSLNILLKFARLYGFDHARTADQFATAWNELHSAIPHGSQTGLLLGYADDQLLLDGMPMGGSPAERSFAQLLRTAGVASILFSPQVTKEDLSRLARGFPHSGGKPDDLSAQMKTALAGATGIRINEVRFVAEDSSLSDLRTAAQLTARTLGVESDDLKAWLTDPQKLLQLIAAAQGSNSGPGGFGPGLGAGPERGQMAIGGGSGIRPSGGVATADTTTGGLSALTLGVGEEDLVDVLKVLTQLGRQMGDTTVDPSNSSGAQRQIAGMPVRNQDLLRQALSNFAQNSTGAKPTREMLVNLAEHLAIRFALERYERGEVKVNAVRQTLERMNKEIESLRGILGQHEEKMAKAGMQVESHVEMLDRQFWASVPETGKRSVLLSEEAWCIPPRNVRSYLKEVLARGDAPLAAQILARYAACINSPEDEARRRAAMGLADLADLYLVDVKTMISAIRLAGMAMSGERDPDIQTLVNAAFVRLSQESAAKHNYPAMQQALISLDGVELQRPAAALSIRPRTGIEERLPEFLEDAARNEQLPEALIDVLRLIPHLAVEQITARFNRAGHRALNDRLAALAAGLGDDAVVRLKEIVRLGAAPDAAEAAGLLSRIDPASVEKWLPGRISEWPLAAQERAVRVLAAAGAPQRGLLLMALYEQFDPLVRPFVLDEIGMSGDVDLAPWLAHFLESENREEGTDYVRLKAIEALGRLRAAGAKPLLQRIVEEKRAWRRAYHEELRISALQAVAKLDPQWAEAARQRAGLDDWQLSFSAFDAEEDSPWYRQRRYQRLRLNQPLSAAITNLTDPARFEVKGLSLSGGMAACERHILPGTHILLKISYGMRSIRAHALMRDVRQHGVGFEFVSMELDDRSRLRRLLFSQLQQPDASPASNLDDRSDASPTTGADENQNPL